jgi:hypothetical protein
LDSGAYMGVVFRHLAIYLDMTYTLGGRFLKLTLRNIGS